MDQLVQCPVCTLYLHNGMSLETHLDTHPKDQVIKALCSLSSSKSNSGSRASTPMHSERSYRSRSRTPATEDSAARWSTHQHHSNDNERYWHHRAPSRTTKSSTVTRSNTPDFRIPEGNIENAVGNAGPQNSFSGRTDKISHHFVDVSSSNAYDQIGFPSFQDREDVEPKYSRSAEYTAQNNLAANNLFTYNLPSSSSCMKLASGILSSPVKKNPEPNIIPHNKKQDYIKILPKNNIALVKANMGALQYLTPSMMVSAGPFVQKSPQNNLLVAANMQSTNPMVQNKSISIPLSTNQYNQIQTTGTFAPNTTVVTQNSQIIYSEMIHNIDGKRFISGVPTVLSNQDSVNNVAQTQSSSVYQNVMVLDQFGNASCMYPAPPSIMPKPNPPVYSQSLATIQEKTESNNSLIIEVSPMLQPAVVDPAQTPAKPTIASITEKVTQVKVDPTPEPSGLNKGLKILSNIKVEVPVKHHRNLLDTVVDLTDLTETDYPPRSKSPERLLPDIDSNSNSSKIVTNETSQASISSNDTSIVSNTFSVIKNVGNPPSYKDSKLIDAKIHETESSDSCPVLDLICNEKPSISPCSELSDNGDNATSHPSITPKSESSHEIEKEIKKEIPIPVCTYKNNQLRLNNIYVKKHKKILQIKNAKPFPLASTSKSSSSDVLLLGGPHSPPRLPQDFTITKLHSECEKEEVKGEKVEPFSCHEKKEIDANTEEQSMDMELEPVTESSYDNSSNYSRPTIDLTQVKDEVNSSNEFSNQTEISDREFTELDPIRPISVVQYGNMDDNFDEDSNHRELLDLEATSKNKQFISIENYFGDNIYTDYFTHERAQSFENREPREGDKEVYNWGESSQRDNAEFVLPNFIHESYKIAESSNYNLSTVLEVARVETDSKADVLSDARSDDLNICADEHMPPRGELSGQESNGDMDPPWAGMYPPVTPAEPYDLMARESWISDGSDVDSNEKRDNLEELVPRPRGRGARVRGARGARRSPPHHDYTNIKVEPNKHDNVLAGMLQDTKAGITTAVIEAYETMVESKPPIFIKEEPKRRRKDYVCPTCKIDQLTDVAFHEHLKIHPLECLTCGKCFFRRANLALHIKTHLGIKNYKCEFCEKRFLTRQKLVEHHNVHTGRAPVKCTLCDHTFRRYSNMVQHRDRHHFNKKPKIRDYVCHCGEVFHSRAKLRWHKETHDGKPKSCHYCSEKFIHMSSLTRHVRRSHNSYYTRDDLKKKNENVPCPICKQVYLRSNLKTHLRTHSGKRPYLCVVCNKAFTTQWNLKLHRWTHMSRSSKPFKCGLCKGAFIRQSEYISHMNAHKSVRPYTCNYCGCQFIRKYNCQRHVREHEMAKKYVCKVPECGKSFHRSYYLSEHMKVHSGARPFTCNICGKTSSNKSNHNKHVKIHHAREPVATEA